jgi:tyrosine-protein kinase Etk/Wzc
MPQETMPPPETEVTAGDIRRVRVADVDDEIDLLQLARMVLQGKRVILKFALISATLTAILVLLMKPVYTAEATFLPPNSMSSSSPASMLGQLGALSGTASALGGLKTPGQIYVGILGSRTVADDLIQRFDLAKVYGTKKLSQTENVLKSNTSILEGKDSIVVIAVKDRDPKLARDLANAYLGSLAKVNNRIALTEAGQRRLFFEQQLESQKNALADAEVALTQSQEKTGLIQPGGQAQLQMSTIAQTQAEISSREIQLRAMSEAATEQNPDVIRLRSEIAGLRVQLAKLENSNTRGEAGNIEVPTAKVPELTLIYVRKAREVKYHEALYDLLLRQYETAKLDESQSAPLMQVVDYATVPDTKSGPQRTLLTLLAAVLGGFAGTVWVLVRYAMNVSMQEPKDAHPNKS